MSDEAAKRTHEAAQRYLREGEVLVGWCMVLVGWCMVLDVLGPGDVRYLAHRHGGGADGTQSPMAWTALGMLRASAQCAEDQLRASTIDHED